MKVKNVSSQTLRIPLLKQSGEQVIINLLPTQFVHSEFKFSEAEKHIENKTLVIYSRKKLIEISETELPKNGEFYHVYNVLVKTNAPHVPIVTLLDDDEEDEDESDSIPDAPNISIEDIDDEMDDNSKKGKGRPPGAKNKSKRGRKKKKNPRGRPKKSL